MSWKNHASPNGDNIALTDFGKDHQIHVVTANKGTCLWKQATGNETIYGTSWANENEFVICGKGFVKFCNIEKKEIINGSGFENKLIGCVTHDSQGKCYASSVDGNIYCFEGTNVVHKIENAHKGKINSIIVNENILYSVGDDKNIILFDKDTHDLKESFKCKEIPRSIDVMDDLIVVGTIQDSIYLYKNKNEEKVWHGHHDGEVWGLAVTDDLVITSGDDNKVIAWDIKTCSPKIISFVAEKSEGKTGKGPEVKTAFSDNQCARALAYNSSSKELAIAANDGTLHIRDMDNLLVNKKTVKYSDHWSQIMEYSPLGNLLAIGTYGNEVLIYSVPNYEEKSKLTDHKSPLICLDWSKDGKYLKTLDKDFDMLFWDASNMTKIEKGAEVTKDVDWATQNCKLGWSVLGIFPDRKSVV